ncbi:MAG: hypothetical protein ACJ73D_03890 [Pyrinomonadaceae bacterium]
MRPALLIIIALVTIAAGGCTTARPSTDVTVVAAPAVTPVSSPTPPHDTYWIIGAMTLIGSGYRSNVIQLPTDDREAVSAAANAWGASHGRMTGKNDAYPFSSAAEAQKFKDEKGELLLEITRDDLIPRLCTGTPEPGTEYWVIAATKEDLHIPVRSPGDNNTYYGKATYTHYISSPLLLPEHSTEAIYRAAAQSVDLRLDEDNTRKFATLSDAEAFVAKTGMEHLELNPDTLNKYLCAWRPEELQSLKSRKKH